MSKEIQINMNSSFNNKNVLKPKNTNIPDEGLENTSKRIRQDEDVNLKFENRNKKRWSFGVKQEERDQLAELGLGMLESDEIMNVETENSESSGENLLNEHKWEFSTDLLPATHFQKEHKDNETTPCCSSTENKENISENNANYFEKVAQQRRELMRDCKESEDFCILRRRPVLVSNAPDLINTLSDEVILQIFKWLPKYSLKKCALVSKRFCRLARDETLWSRIDLTCRSLYPGALGYILDRGVQIMRLSQTEISDPAILPNSKSFSENYECKLQYLDLSMAVVSLDTLATLFKRCKSLKKLSLENVPVNEEVCKYLSQNEGLEVLNMTMVTGLNLNCMRYLLTSLERLRELNIAWTHLNYQTLSYVCLNLPFSLSRLNISGCRKTLLDNNVRSLVNCCPNLRELDLSDCISLTFEAVDTILELENLRFLAMSRCYAIPPAAFKKLKLMSNLASFDIHGHMPEAALHHLKEYFGDQIIINKFLFSSVARPTVGIKRSSIWNLRVKD